MTEPIFINFVTYHIESLIFIYIYIYIYIEQLYLFIIFIKLSITFPFHHDGSMFFICTNPNILIFYKGGLCCITFVYLVGGVKR